MEQEDCKMINWKVGCVFNKDVNGMTPQYRLYRMMMSCSLSAQGEFSDIYSAFNQDHLFEHE